MQTQRVRSLQVFLSLILNYIRYGGNYYFIGKIKLMVKFPGTVLNFVNRKFHSYCICTMTRGGIQGVIQPEHEAWQIGLYFPVLPSR